ncbi:porin [Thauera sinica]|uniref:Porin n=1 Tax=Thauera sinica TaxID=2665146 RepID=A0ABW1AT21_9RHOO|nr:porin [Thauera sp. K11]ATE58810.1 porin [Thauera sp. K11]
MQKKLIALAVAGLVSVPAFAQSNVTIYGIVDMGYVYRGDNVVDGVKNRSGIDSGVANGSRIGFKGTEDLGNGLKAGFVLEQGILADTGTSAQGGRTFGRQSFVSLGGNFGTVALGRQYAPGYLLLDSIDPFSTGTVGQSNNVYLGEVRLDNLLAYVSPTWSGFSFSAGYTLSAYGNESLGNESVAGDVRAWAISPKYVNGPLTLGLNFHEIKMKSTGAADGDKVRVYDFGGSYNFGVVKLGAIYGIRKADGVDFGQFEEGEDSKQWLVGVTVPVSASGNVLASYAHRKTDIANSSKDAKVSQWAIGYEHWLSKRTGLYATYADINNNKAAEHAGDEFLIGSVGDATSGGGGYQRGFNVGIRHFF